MTIPNWTQITDDEVLAALKAQEQYNPTGASATDVLAQFGGELAMSDALERLVAAGNAKRTSPGNYLPVTNS